MTSRNPQTDYDPLNESFLIPQNSLGALRVPLTHALEIFVSFGIGEVEDAVIVLDLLALKLHQHMKDGRCDHF